MKPPHTISNTLIEKTLTVWQQRIPRYRTDNDARQIAEHATGLFAILAEWSRAAKPVPANDATVAAPTTTAEVCHDR